jgi:predicted nucleic acid-binding protein
MSARSARFTLDTNILVYSVDSAAGWKHELAIEIVDRAAERDCLLTLQAVSEFFVATTCKRLMPEADAAAQAADWLEIFPSVPSSTHAIRTALDYVIQRRIAYWDALMVATAGEAGCTIILTEDLQDGARLKTVEIHNPFARGGKPTNQARQLLGLD